jgi:hypothetical protein
MVNSKKIILFIVSNNGIGHLRRVIEVVKYLSKKKFFSKCFIYLDKKLLSVIKWDKKIYLKNKKIKWLFFKKKISNDEFINFNKNLKFLYNNKNFITADIVISDNLAIPLESKKKIILMGSFLWSDLSLKKKYRSFKTREKFLLKKYKPQMICQKSINCINNKNVKKIIINWIRRKIIYKNKLKNGILFSPSKFINIKKTTRVIDHLLKYKKNKLYIPRSFYPLRKYFKRTSNFKFTNTDFKKIQFSFCRPGLGAVEDCISNKIFIFETAKDKNIEIVHNSKVLKNLGLLNRIDERFFKMSFENYLSLIKFSLPLYLKTINKINSNGLKEIYYFLKNIKNEQKKFN